MRQCYFPRLDELREQRDIALSDFDRFNRPNRHFGLWPTRADPVGPVVECQPTPPHPQIFNQDPWRHAERRRESRCLLGRSPRRHPDRVQARLDPRRQGRSVSRSPGGRRLAPLPPARLCAFLINRSIPRPRRARPFSACSPCLPNLKPTCAGSVKRKASPRSCRTLC